MSYYAHTDSYAYDYYDASDIAYLDIDAFADEEPEDTDPMYGPYLLCADEEAREPVIALILFFAHSDIGF